jgi:hypothetical protein
MSWKCCLCKTPVTSAEWRELLLCADCEDLVDNAKRLSEDFNWECERRRVLKKRHEVLLSACKEACDLLSVSCDQISANAVAFSETRIRGAQKLLGVAIQECEETAS